MKRLLLYVHYNRFNQLSEHVLYQLEQLNPIFSRIVFISNSHLDDRAIDELRERRLIDDLIQRGNSGFDFGAWRDGMDAVGWEQLKDFDVITLMNDTCFGPLWDVASIYQTYEADSTVDFWGMTNHRALDRIPEHLQSYFMTFKRDVILSPVFAEFWRNIEDFEDVQDVIDQYETQVTNRFVSQGFRYQAYFDTLDEPLGNMAYPDFSFYNTAAILSHGVPFLKIKPLNVLTQDTPFIIDYVDEKTSYPAGLMRNHLAMTFDSSQAYQLTSKYANLEAGYQSFKESVAIHLHVTQTEQLPQFLDVFKSYPFAFDLYVTTDNLHKQETVKSLLSDYKLPAHVVATSQLGSDILPLLKLKKHLSRYDFVGHFHTLSDTTISQWQENSWREDLLEMMVRPAAVILTELSQDAESGLVLADTPRCSRMVKEDPQVNQQVVPMLNTLWKKMDMAKPLDLSRYTGFVRSQGNFIWFKYDALAPLFDLDLTEDNLPKDNDLQSHLFEALERVLVYLAWGRNYEFLISPNRQAMTPMIDAIVLNKEPNQVFDPKAKIDFTQFGGLKGAVAFFFHANFGVIKYVSQRLFAPLIRLYHKVMPFG